MSDAPLPNFLVIMSDQHNPHVLGCAGDAVVRTPNLDRLARKGVRFTANYCPYPLCAPSRMGFLTSRQCSDIELFNNLSIFRSDIPTFAHSLAVAGYDTILCGRMHIVGPDQYHGFTRRIGGDLQTSYGLYDPAKLTGAVPMGTTGRIPVALEHSGPGRTTYQAYDRDVTDECLRYIEARSREKDNERPFCLVVGYVLPHSPYICPRDLFDEYYSTVTVPQLPGDYFETLHPAVVEDRRRKEADRPTPAQARMARAAYYGLVTLMDRNIGEILDALASSPFASNTTICYTSDHGDMAGEHGLWMKMSHYEGSVSVPMIFSGAGVDREGAAVESVTSLLDIGPTLIELANGPSLPLVAGRSLVRFLSGDGAPGDWPDEAISEILAWRFSRMIRRGDWKLVQFEGYNTPQLFHVATDPEEFHDRGADPECAEIRASLSARLAEGWSMDECRRQMARSNATGDLLRRWAGAARIPEPYYWVAPPDAVVFPEPAPAEG